MSVLSVLDRAKQLLADLDARLAADGDVDTEEADAIRDELDLVWRGLTPGEREEFDQYARSRAIA